MGSVISGFSGFSIAVLLCMHPLPAYPIEIDNPYVKSPSATPLPLPKPSYGRPPPQTGYHPHAIEITPRSRTDSGPNINHLQWCQSRYKSYRRSDNSYVLRGGGRQMCTSPFQP